MNTARLRVGPPCTRDQRYTASLDTVRHEQRSLEKQGQIYRTGSLTEGTHEAHRFPCCSARYPAGQTATYKGRPSLSAPRTDPCKRNSRTRLLPRVFDGKAHAWPG